MITETISKKFKDSIQTNNQRAIQTKFCELIIETGDSFNNSRDCKGYLYELTRCAITKELSIDNYFIFIDWAVKEHQEFVNKTIIEILWLCGFGIEKAEKKTEAEEEMTHIYSTIVNTLLKKKIVTHNSLIEKLEETSLKDCGLVGDLKNFRTKITRLNTKITYEQQKYNLLREESEGFSKLIFLLFEMEITKDNWEVAEKKILCLIGFFDLDPIRVLDLALSAFEADPYNVYFLNILRILNLRALPHVLGFKFNSILTVPEEESTGLYIITAQLIKHTLLKLEDILPHLSPSNKELEAIFQNRLTSSTTYNQTLYQRVFRELNLVNGSSGASSVNPTTSDSANIVQNANNFVNFTDIVAEALPQPGLNQKIRLFEGLIRVKSHYYSEMLYNYIENFYDPMSSKLVITALCDTIKWMIEPIYAPLSYKDLFKRDRKKKVNSDESSCSSSSSSSINNLTQVPGDYIQVSTPDEFINEIPKILKYITIGLSTDQILFQKLLKIIKVHINRFIGNIYETVIVDLIIKVFLPSLSIIDPTPALVNELWGMLSQFDYTKRYKIYNYWINTIYNTHPILFLKYSVVIKETSKWHKTLSKENQRQHGRTLGILTNSNPIIVFDNVIRLLISYDNLINIFIQTLSLASSLSYDVITYILCRILADPSKEKLNSSSGDMNSWFKNFAYLIGSFYKKYPMAELGGIIYYLCNKLKNSSSYLEMYSLKEIIEKMSGVGISEEMDENQVLACSGGLYLFLEEMDLLKEYKHLKKPIQALLKFFTSSGNLIDRQEKSKDKDKDALALATTPNLSFTSVFLILLAIRRNNIIFTHGYQQPKLIGLLYDEIQNIFIQLVTFLTLYTDRDTFTKFLPKWTPDKYVINYNASPEVIFFLIRNTLKPIYEQSSNEYNDNVSNFVNVLDVYQSINKNHFNNEFDPMYIDKKNFIEDIYRTIWKHISPELYFIFNSLQLKDIYCPLNRYETAIEGNIKDREKLISGDDGNIGMSLNINSAGGNQNNQSGNPNIKADSQMSKNKKEIEKINNNIDNLQKELKQCKRNYDSIIKFLESKTNLLDDIPNNNKRDVSKYLVQYLLYPRLTFSKVDAVYTAKMLSLLISLKIQNVNVFDIMQKLIKFFLPCILCVTEFEAQNIGCFLNEFLKSIKEWQEEKTWNEECLTNPCFSRSLEATSSVELNDFKKAIVCLLSKMNTTFQTIFNSDDYMSCRNALIVLSTMINVYPPTREIAQDIVNSIGKAQEKFEIYDDLSTMMKRYRDILSAKIQILPNENEISGEKMMTEKSEKVEKEKSSSRTNGDRKRKKERSREREKRKEEPNRTPDIRKRSPDDYRQSKKMK